MIKELNKVVDKMVELSTNGYLTVSYENKFISIDFHATEQFDLEVRDELDIIRLWYVDEIHACPCDVTFKKSDIKEATYFTEGEFDKLPFAEIIVLTFNDGSELHCFEDVR